MTRINRARRTAGFTLYGVIVGMLLFGIALHPIVSTLATNARIATDRQQRLDAERVLRNEMAVLAAAHPDSVPAPRTYRADRTGRMAGGGAYEVTTRRSVRCGIGGAPHDNVLEPPPSGCAAGGVVHDYAVTVTFPRAAGAADQGSVTRHFSVAASSRGPAPGTLP